MKVGIIGVGNMGSKYASMIQNNEIEGMTLGALTRLKEDKKILLSKSIEAGVPVFESAELLFEALEKGEIELDAVIITTPHYSHSEIAIRAFKNGLHVLCDKPSGVYLRQANEMNKAAAESKMVFGMIFNQRTNLLYLKMKEIVESGIYGKIKRVNWVVTDWYRPEGYYKSSPWRATWAKDGGGVLLNQCSHNLDLLQWICGMPKMVQGFCHEGRFHDIEVEDDVTAYFEWDNGATGIFITSTGDAPGINRFEISLEEAMLVCENGELRIGEIEPEIGMKEHEYRKNSSDYFKKINGVWKTYKPDTPVNAYHIILSNFKDAAYKLSEENNYQLIAPGADGRNSLAISNAIYLSSWMHKMVEIPEQGSNEEKIFENYFEEKLKDLS